VLVAAMTLGGVGHRHLNSSDTNCPICHLTHQPIEPLLATDRSPALYPLGPRQEPEEYGCSPCPATGRVPARAPPSPTV